MTRIILAGFLGGLVLFVAGALEHAVLSLVDRNFKPFPDEKAVHDLVISQNLSHGVYGFPTARAEINEQEWNRLAALYRQANGTFFIGRAGEEMMSSSQLGLEFGSNVVVALLAAFIVSRLRPRTGFGTRWLIVVFMGVAGWFSISASHAIWYRFHWDFVRDELICASLEAALMGLVIAAIVKTAAEVEPKLDVPQKL